MKEMILHVGDHKRICTTSLFINKACKSMFNELSYGYMEVASNDGGDSYVIVNDKNEFACYASNKVEVIEITISYIKFYCEDTKKQFKLAIEEAMTCIC